MMKAKDSIINELDRLASIVPIPISWSDVNNVILGANQYALNRSGAKFLKDLIGKTPYDVYPAEIAEKIVHNCQEVIRTGKIFTGEEVVKDVITNELKYFTVVRAPLFDNNGKIIGTFGISINVTEEKKEAERLKKARVFEHLEMIAKIIPAPFYWLDANNVVLGINDLVIKIIGGETCGDFIGKNPYDLYPKDMADNIVQANEEIMRTGKIITQEEPIKDITTGKSKCFTAVKAPLYDDDGKIIGTIGISIDITAEKEAENLRIESELQKNQLREQEKFKKIASQVAHDIRSPLASLLMVVKTYEKDIPESARVALREASINIGDIANNLLNKYNNVDVEVNARGEEREPIIVFLLLSQILTDKKYQYGNLAIKFQFDHSQAGGFSFINVEPIAFKRMMSNLINNAVDACVGKSGVIAIKLSVDQAHVRITIQDNGKGMPSDVIDKISSGVAVTANKDNGHGIGFTQIRETLQRNQGQFLIESQVGMGTKIMLTFPRVASAEWFAEVVKVRKGDIVVVLDDDTSIHGAWNARFCVYLRDIQLQHFTTAIETINFINAAPIKDAIFLLTDFELLEQELNGISVIERTGVKRSILVTSHYANRKVRNRAMEIGTKVLPKQLASDVPIILEENAPSSLKKVDLVIIDDNQLFADSLAMLFNGKVVDTYYHPVRFLDKIAQYPKDTKICMDNDLSYKITGVELAKQLHDAGYTHLYLLSGTDFAFDEIPGYLTIINKSDMDKFAQVLG